MQPRYLTLAHFTAGKLCFFSVMSRADAAVLSSAGYSQLARLQCLVV
jgi:hypothetical protein